MCIRQCCIFSHDNNRHLQAVCLILATTGSDYGVSSVRNRWWTRGKMVQCDVVLVKQTVRFDRQKHITMGHFNHAAPKRPFKQQ